MYGYCLHEIIDSPYYRCSLWLLYGILINDKSVITVNMFGSSLQFFYAFTFYIYTVKKNLIVKQMLAALTFISMMYLYWFAAEDIAWVTKIVGLISCTLTIMFFASPLTMLVSLFPILTNEIIIYLFF